MFLSFVDGKSSAFKLFWISVLLANPRLFSTYIPFDGSKLRRFNSVSVSRLCIAISEKSIVRSAQIISVGMAESLSYLEHQSA